MTYNDIPFIMSKNPFTGDINTVKDVYAVRQSIRNIVMTIRGERPFNDSFGANPINNLFDTLTTLMEIECKNLIQNAIATYEPRVKLTQIIIDQSKVNPNKINIFVVYDILNSGLVDSISLSLERTR